jgi:hypothetical protein
VALPTTSVSIRWLPDSENEEEQYIQRFTYKYFDHLMTMTDFTTLFDLYKVKITNSADFGNQQARTFGFLPNIPWMRERILLSIVAFFYFGERKHELLLVGSILILIIWSMVQQRRISALGAYSNLLAAKSTALELIDGRIDKQLTEESRTTEIGNVRSSSSLNVFLTIGGANLHYSQSYFYVSVGNIWRRQFHSPRDLI